ncbi:MAG: aminoglycoside phosphotransferase family protein [Anaerolineales bacterium]|nr:aminoglycoside phosphotransferase family protein [Anaerolineales bacterium]
MLEKPDIADETIITCLAHAYGLDVAELTFLPLGADVNTAVYRARTRRQTPYFVKLRRDFAETAVLIPKFLADRGLQPIIPPLPTRTGALWTTLPHPKSEIQNPKSLIPYCLIVYPFVNGRNGFETLLLDRHRVELGAALRQLHTTALPAALANGIPRETFAPRWRESVSRFLAQIDGQTFAEPVAAELAAFLHARRQETGDLVARAHRLARALQARPPAFVLCHGDIHGWNLLIDDDDALHIVDWDTLILAPKERDLMFVGCGLGGNGHTLQEEERLFYEGYGPTAVNHTALAYYRYERIIEDIAVICAQLLTTDAGEADRRAALAMLKSNFGPDGTIDLAIRTDETAREA